MRDPATRIPCGSICWRESGDHGASEQDGEDGGTVLSAAVLSWRKLLKVRGMAGAGIGKKGETDEKILCIYRIYAYSRGGLYYGVCHQEYV